MLRTTDGGATWRIQPSGTFNNLWGVCFTDANTGTVVGVFGTVLRTKTGGEALGTIADKGIGTVAVPMP